MIIQKVMEIKYVFDNSYECIEIRKAIEEEDYEIVICNTETKNPYLVARKKCI